LDYLQRIVPSKWLDYDLSTKLMQLMELMPEPFGGREITCIEEVI